MDPLEALTGLLNALGQSSPTVIAIALAILFGYGFVKGWWVPGWVYDREIKRAETARDAVMASTDATEKAATAAKTATDAALLLLQQYATEQRVRALNRPKIDE